MTNCRNAKLTPAARLELVRRIVEDGEGASAVADAMHVSRSTARKWLTRFQQEGPAGLASRPSGRHASPWKTPPDTLAAVIGLRRQRLTALQIARTLQIGRSTVAAYLKSAGLGRLQDLDVERHSRRYERAHAGESVR